MGIMVLSYLVGSVTVIGATEYSLVNFTLPDGFGSRHANLSSLC